MKPNQGKERIFSQTKKMEIPHNYNIEINNFNYYKPFYSLSLSKNPIINDYDLMKEKKSNQTNIHYINFKNINQNNQSNNKNLNELNEQSNNKNIFDNSKISERSGVSLKNLDFFNYMPIESKEPINPKIPNLINNTGININRNFSENKIDFNINKNEYNIDNSLNNINSFIDFHNNNNQINLKNNNFLFDNSQIMHNNEINNNNNSLDIYNNSDKKNANNIQLNNRQNQYINHLNRNFVKQNTIKNDSNNNIISSNINNIRKNNEILEYSDIDMDINSFDEDSVDEMNISKIKNKEINMDEINEDDNQDLRNEENRNQLIPFNHNIIQIPDPINNAEHQNMTEIEESLIDYYHLQGYRNNRPNQTRSNSNFLIKYTIDYNNTNFCDYLYDYVNCFSTYVYYICVKDKIPSNNNRGKFYFYVQFIRSNSLSYQKLPNCEVGSVNISSLKIKNMLTELGIKVGEDGYPRKKGGITYDQVQKMEPNERVHLSAYLAKTIEKMNTIDNNLCNGVSKEKPVSTFYFYGDDLDNINHCILECLKESRKNFDILRYSNHFWTGTSKDNVRIAFYPKFTDRDMNIQEFMNFTDFIVYPMDIKGGYYLNKYNIIIITSVQKPNEIYPDDIYKNVTSKLIIYNAEMVESSLDVERIIGLDNFDLIGENRL